MTWAYWSAVLLYCLAVMALGWKLRRKTGEKSQLEFWLAGRELPGWRLGVSLTSGWLMLGWIGFGMSQIYMYGASGLWILPIPWVLLTFVIVASVPVFRRIPTISIPQALQRRFGSAARVLAAVMSFGVFLSWTQAELFMAGTLVSPLLGIPAWVAMLVVVFPVLFYTWFGGFRAIVTTDILQFAIMAAFMIVLAAAAVHLADVASAGDMAGALKAASPPWAGAGQAGNLWFLGSLFPLVLLIGYLPGWLLEQDLVIRIQAAPSTQEARKGAWLGVLLIGVFICLLPSLAAFCALVAFPPVDGAAASAVGPDALGIISAIIAGLPGWLSILMVLGLVACQMSTIDTFSNVTAMALAHDLVEPSLKRRSIPAGKRHTWSRLISMFAILAALAAALASERLGDVYYVSSGVLSACIAVPFLSAFWKRATSAGVVTGIILGLAGSIGGYFWEYYTIAETWTEVLPGWLQNSYGYNYLALGVILAAAGTIVASVLTRHSPRENPGAVQPEPVEGSAFTLAAEAW
jgi:SSS family solute:Na+ symporter